MANMLTPMDLCKCGDEHSEQVALMQWVLWHKKDYPELELLFAIPNGGDRDKRTAGRLKAEGVKPGVSDMMLPVARHGKHGIWIELKKLDGGSGESEVQIEWGRRMRIEGYAYFCANGWQAAAKGLISYLGMREKPFPDGSLQSQIKR